MIPVREFSSAAEMQANARAVKAKLWGRPSSPRVVVKFVGTPTLIAEQQRAEADRMAREAEQKRQEQLRLARMAWREITMGVNLAMSAELSAKEDMPVLKYPKMREVLAFVLACSPFDAEDICAPRRTADLVRYRQVAMWAMVTFTSCSLPQIGRALGGKDHTTVLHAKRKMEAIREASGIVVDRENWTSTISALLDATQKGGVVK